MEGMKLFIPACGYRIKLSKSWTFDLHNERRNKTLIEAQGEKFSWSWREDKPPYKVTLEAGTVLEVDRVYIRTFNKGATGKDDYDSITFRVVSGPEKKNVKKRFWAKLVDVNNIEYELPENHTAGKDQAIQNAKRPKRHVLSEIKTDFHSALQDYRRDKAPAWLTVDLAIKLAELCDEYYKLMEPYEIKRIEENNQRRLKDYNAYGNWYARMTPVKEEFKKQDWTSFAYNEIVNSYNPVTFSKPGGVRCRTFRGEKCWNRNHSEKPGVDHLWIKIYTDDNDENIVKVEAGIDPVKK